jgi:hypothetical protein
MVSFLIVEKTTFRSVFINNSVFNLHFMKVSTAIDNNFGYEKISQLVDNIPLTPETSKCYHGNNVIQISCLHIIFTDLSFYIT